MVDWLVACHVQGLDDAFVSQAPIMDQYAEDLYDSSDPTDRQQIEWRQSPRAGTGNAEPTSSAVSEQQPAEGSEADVEGGVSSSTPAKPHSTAGEAVSVTSDHTGAAVAAAAEHPGSSKQLSIPAQLQKDAFLVFRALCKLSIRSTEAAPGSEITTIRGKVGEASRR